MARSRRADARVEARVLLLWALACGERRVKGRS